VTPRDEIHALIDRFDDDELGPALHAVVDTLPDDLIPALLKRMQALQDRLPIYPPEPFSN